MITVPAALKTEIEKLRGRRLQARCRFDFSDTSIDNSILAYASSANNAALYQQLFNGKEDVSFKYLSLDGSCLLTGEYYIPPETQTEIERYEFGWWSEEMSADDRNFPILSGSAFSEVAFGESAFGLGVSAPEVSVNFTHRQVQEIAISFDNSRMEYAEDFDVYFHGIDNAVLYSESITGNTGLKYSKAIGVYNGVCIIRYVIKKWSHAYRNAKVAEMFTMISLMVNGSDIVSMQTVEDRELSNDGIPIGTTSAGSFVLRFYNRDRLFDWDNTDSRLYNFIRKGVKALPEIGDGTNWVSMGTYFIEEWDIPKNDLNVTVTGLDRMASLDESEYITSQAIQAPDDYQLIINTTAEWESATLDGIEASSDSIRMVFS